MIHTKAYGSSEASEPEAPQSYHNGDSDADHSSNRNNNNNSSIVMALAIAIARETVREAQVVTTVVAMARKRSIG